MMICDSCFKVRLFVVVIAISIISCSSYKKLDLKSFSMEVPTNWKYVPQKGVDSYVGIIDIGNNDLLHFDLGLYANNLQEEKAFMITEGNRVHFKDGDHGRREGWKYAGKLNEIDTNLFISNSYLWTKLDGKKAKIVIPQKSGRGTTGVYFPKAQSDKFADYPFQINGEDLTPENQKAFLKAIKTLKFKRE